VSTAGGLDNAPVHGRAIGADVIQIFTRNQVQWKAKTIGPEEAAAFRAAMAASGLRLAVSHGSYLVNLATPDPGMLEKSREAFAAEMARCHALGIPYLVFHPGAHMGSGESAGLRQIAESLDLVLEREGGGDVRPLLEVTAGQGSYVGHRFEHLAQILDRVRRPERLGVCLDTCHLLAAGYDIATAEGYEATVAACARLIGLDRVKAFHLNDAKAALGSHLDRHAPIGAGHLGRETFRRLMTDRRFAGVPMFLETPGPLETWKREIALLRRLATAGRAASS
jgi:deoxyribonuclease-4